MMLATMPMPMPVEGDRSVSLLVHISTLLEAAECTNEGRAWMELYSADLVCADTILRMSQRPAWLKHFVEVVRFALKDRAHEYAHVAHFDRRPLHDAPASLEAHVVRAGFQFNAR